MDIFIYKLLDPRDGSAHYVGKTNKPKVRMKRHCSTRWNSPYSSWTHKLLGLGLRPQIEIIEVTDENVWHEREQYWIARLRSEGQPLKNVATWQSPGPGFQHRMSEITREKLRQAFRGRPIPPEQRAQISQTLTGKKQSPETIAKRKATINANRAILGKPLWNFGMPELERKRIHSATTRKSSPAYLKRKVGHPEKFSTEWKAKIAATLKARFASLTPEQQERLREQGRNAKKAA